MKLRTFKEEDSFHKKEIVERVSTELNQTPIVDSENVVLWVFSEQKIGILMELNTELSCPLINPPEDYDYRWAWSLQLFVAGKKFDHVCLRDQVFKIPFSDCTLSYKNYVSSFIKLAKQRLD